MKHGGDLTEAIAQHGGVPEGWLDLSTGISPWSWPIPRHLPESIWQRLPSRADTEALNAVARKAYGMPEDVQLAAAGGTQALIQLLPYLTAPGPVAMSKPAANQPGQVQR